MLLVASRYLAARRAAALGLRALSSGPEAVYEQEMRDKLAARRRPKRVALEHAVLACKTPEDVEMAARVARRVHFHSIATLETTAGALVQRCLEHGKLDLAVSVVTDKPAYGLYPARGSYHKLMKALSDENRHKGNHCGERRGKERRKEKKKQEVKEKGKRKQEKKEKGNENGKEKEKEK